MGLVFARLAYPQQGFKRPLYFAIILIVSVCSQAELVHLSLICLYYVLYKCYYYVLFRMFKGACTLCSVYAHGNGIDVIVKHTLLKCA